MTDYSELTKKTHIALITESWRESFARDLTTASTFVLLWSIGHFADSAALEWVGVSLGFMMLFTRLLGLLKTNMDNRMTPDEARAWLDKHFPKGGDQ